MYYNLSVECRFLQVGSHNSVLSYSDVSADDFYKSAHEMNWFIL